MSTFLTMLLPLQVCISHFDEEAFALAEFPSTGFQTGQLPYPAAV